MRVSLVLLLTVLLARAEPPEGMRCFVGSTHAHAWYPTGGDDGGMRIDARGTKEPGGVGGPEYREFRRSRPELYAGGTPLDAYRYARDRGGLDFLALTIHNHMALPEEAQLLRQAAATVNEESKGAFCALYGQEWSTISSGNHVNLLGSAPICDLPKGEYGELFRRWLPAQAGTALVVLNHPWGERERGGEGAFTHRLLPLEYGLDDFGGDAAELAAAARPYVRLVEVVNGPPHGVLENFRRWRARPGGYYRYLNRGFRVGPCVGTDNHFQNWGTSSPCCTGVWAASLDSPFILEGLAARRTFASEDRTLRVWLEVEGAPMGSELVTAARSVRVRAVVSDSDEPEAPFQLRVLVDPDGFLGEEALVVKEWPEARPGPHDFRIDLPACSTYLLLHLVQRADEDSAWSAPVWIDRPGTAK